MLLNVVNELEMMDGWGDDEARRTYNFIHQIGIFFSMAIF